MTVETGIKDVSLGLVAEDGKKKGSSNPDIIKIEEHPLCYRPHFSEFADLWNYHVVSPERTALKEEVDSALSKIAQFPDETSRLKAIVERLEEERARQQQIFDSQENVSKREKFAPLKRANRNLRRAREKLEKVSIHEGKARKAEDDHFAQASETLAACDLEFGFGLEEDHVPFFAAVRLGEKQRLVDKFFLGYCERLNMTDALKGVMLFGFNLTYFHLAKRLNGDDADVTAEMVRAAVNRQLDSIGAKRY